MKKIANATPEAGGEITSLLAAWQGGDTLASEQLVPLIYPELRKIAKGLMSVERVNHTLQPTAVIHEAYLRLIQQKRVSWQDRHQFFAISARMIQRILVDHARQRWASKRGGQAEKIPLSEVADLAVERPDLLIELDEALKTLEEIDSVQASIVQAKFFAGLTGVEIAEALGLSPATVKRKWRVAKVWLFHELNKASADLGEQGEGAAEHAGGT